MESNTTASAGILTDALFPPFAALVEQSTWTPEVGEIVENFGQIARVISIDPERGTLLRALPGQGFTRGRDRWYADATKCRPVR